MNTKLMGSPCLHLPLSPCQLLKRRNFPINAMPCALSPVPCALCPVLSRGTPATIYQTRGQGDKESGGQGE